jgi:hypothetical protein
MGELSRQCELRKRRVHGGCDLPNLGVNRLTLLGEANFFAHRHT